MEWARILAYITGTVDRELLLRNEYLAAENRILRGQLSGRLRLSDAERATLGEIAHRLGRKALGEVANAALPDTILALYRKLVARKFDGSKSRQGTQRSAPGTGFPEAETDPKRGTVFRQRPNEPRSTPKKARNRRATPASLHNAADTRNGWWMRQGSNYVPGTQSSRTSLRKAISGLVRPQRSISGENKSPAWVTSYPKAL